MTEVCTACDLHKTCVTPCMAGIGRKPAKVMIVGEAPGAYEDIQGEPFVGASGNKLRETMMMYGLDPDECFITNAVKCRPPSNATPTAKQIRACKPWLEDEIREVQPEYIIAVGSIAWRALGGTGSITKVRGTVHELNGLKVYPILHPAYVLRQPNRERTFRADVAYIANLINDRIDDEIVPYTIVTTSEQLFAMRDELLAEDTYAIGYDIETDYEETNNRIMLIGLAKMDKACDIKTWVVPWEHPVRNEAELRYMDIVQVLKEVLEPPKPLKVAQNAYRFDNARIRTRGIKPYLGFDTLLAAHILDENSPHDLGFLARTYLGVKDWKSDVKYSINYPFSKLAAYNAKDLGYMMKVMLKQQEQLRQDIGLGKVFAYIMMPIARVLEDVQEHGCYAVPEVLKETEAKLQKELEDKYQHLVSMIPEEFKNINPGSSQQVSELLFGALGLSPIKVSDKTGSPSTDADVLTRLEHPVATAIKEWREINKLITAYINPWKKYLMDSPDHRFHPTFKPHGTVTGRLSATNPSLQTVPRNAAVRRIISAPPGWHLVEVDYSQMELRIAASVSNELTMIEAFREGKDIHTETARDVVLSDPTHEVTKEERQHAKAVNFGFLYGMSAYGFVNYAFVNYGVKLTLEEAEERRRRYFEKYPRLAEWHSEVKRELRRTEQIRSPLGRLRRFPGYKGLPNGDYVKSMMEREAINCAIQATGSDICLLAGIEIHNQLPRDKVCIVNFVHDSILFEIKEECLEEYLPIIISIMTDMDLLLRKFSWRPAVPIEVEAKVGPWGEGKVWNVQP